MKVLLLSPYFKKLTSPIIAAGDNYMVYENKINLDFCISNKIEFIVSYGYRHLISKDIINKFNLKIINLHISFLPFCKGAHPLFWSVANNEKTGVTIHLIDEGLDTGNILFRKEISYSIKKDSFSTIYKKMCNEIENLFAINWLNLRNGDCKGLKQIGTGSYHKSNEIENMKRFLPKGWDTPIKDFKYLIDNSKDA